MSSPATEVSVSKVLLTGASGFVGRILVPMLQEAGYEVGVLSSRSHGMAGVQEWACDIRDLAAVAQVVQQFCPDRVVHLAAQANVPVSFREPVFTWQVNVMGTVNLLAAIREHAPRAFVLFVSSSEVYGESFKSGMPLDEDAPCRPLNPYAASKLAAELACGEYFRQGLAGVIVRPFNHIGPGQSADFAMPAFARQIARIEAGLQPPLLQVGNLEAGRDFLDVRDVCRAYLALLELAGSEGYSRCFNVASGSSRSMREMLERLLQETAQAIRIEQDPERMRPSDIPLALGSHARLCRETPWQPAIDLDDTCRSILDDWRARVRDGRDA